MVSITHLILSLKAVEAEEVMNMKRSIEHRAMEMAGLDSRIVGVKMCFEISAFSDSSTECIERYGLIVKFLGVTNSFGNSL